jgi:hypothetical protein
MSLQDSVKEAGEVCPHADEMVIHGVGTTNTRLHIACFPKIFMSPPAESDEDKRHLYPFHAHY